MESTRVSITPFSKSCRLNKLSKISKVSSKLCLAEIHPIPSVNQTNWKLGIFLDSSAKVL